MARGQNPSQLNGYVFLVASFGQGRADMVPEGLNGFGARSVRSGIAQLVDGVVKQVPLDGAEHV